MKDFEKFDIGIIGGGPAGSSAALLLCRAGFNVCLFEKKEFPRETVCGEFLSREVYTFLIENGLEQQFLSLNPNPINSVRIIFEKNISIKSDLNFIGYGLKRSTFDSFLLRAAIDSGARVFQPVNVSDIIRNKNGFIINFSNKNENCSVSCVNVIAAYGKQNFLDKKLERNFIGIKSNLNGVKFHFDISELPGFEKNEIQIYSTDSMYCGVNAVNENKVTVCFLENRYRNNYSSRDHLITLFEKNIGFSNLFLGNLKDLIENSEIFGTGNIYFGEKGVINNGIFMTGDAAHVIAPLAGDGISIALQNARLLEKVFVHKRDNNMSSLNAELLYKELWKKEFQKRILTALYIQKVLFNKYLNMAGRKLISSYPGLMRYLINYTRG